MPRLPNPPEVFEGRVEERAWLGGRLLHAPLSILWGPLGIGKTGLALTAVRRADLDPVLYVSALDAPTDVAFLSGLSNELCALREDAVAWEGRGRTRTELVALVLELAERTHAVVVLDDLHAIDPTGVEQILIAVSRYAERSRFLALTRARPRHAELAEKTLRLEPLANEAVTRVVKRCAPSTAPSEVLRIVNEAAGSPYRARSLVLGRDPASFGSIVGDLGEQTRRAVLGLRLLPIAVELPPAVLDDLEARGLVRLTEGRARLDDRLRAILDAEPLDAEPSRLAALELAGATSGPSAIFERVRLLLMRPAPAHGACADPHFDAARALLERHRIELFVAGCASAVFDLLERSADRTFDAHRFACAEWTQSGPALAWTLAADPPEAEAARLVWCKLLAHGGLLQKARAEATALTHASAPDVRRDATLLLADLHCLVAEPERAIAVLDAFEAGDPLSRAERDLRLGTACVAAGDLPRALALLDAHPEESAELAPSDRKRLMASLVSVLLAAGRFRELERVLGTAEPPPDTRANLLFAHLALAVERGWFEPAETLLRRVRCFADESVHLRFVHGYSTIRVRLTVGPFEELAAFAHALAHDTGTLELPDLVAWSRAAKAAVDVLVAPPARFDEPPEVATAFSEPASALLDAWRAIVAARRGEAMTLQPRSAVSTDVAAFVERARAEIELVRGEFEAAATTLARALEAARTAGLALDEAALLALLVDARLLQTAGGGDPTLAAYAASDLRTLAERLKSPRYLEEARLGAWLATPPDARAPAPLLALAESTSSPVAARRATGILGRPVVLDDLDRRVVELGRRGALASAEATMILDLGARALRLPSGLRVDLSGSSLNLRILEVLARMGGRATKEALVHHAWSQSSYHPHRDDQRLHVAIHRLRHLLEKEPKSPAFVLREGDEYRLAVPIRVGAIDPR